jgi:hypothetical protein
LLGVVIALGTGWQKAIAGRPGDSPDGVYWMRTGVPAALLVALTGAYFAGRAVDYVILIAVPPFALLFVPAFLSCVDHAMNRDRVAIALSAIPLTAFFVIAAFSSLYLFRVGSPYSLVIHECRDKGRCSVNSLLEGLSETMRFRLGIDQGHDVWAQNSRDVTGTIAEAVDLIDRYAAKDAQVTVLLGETEPGRHMTSDMALMYAHRWHTWPRSFTFTDELVPALVAHILAGPVTLRTGDIVILRRDEINLGYLESGILKIVRSSGSLCFISGLREVAAYRFWKNGDPEPSNGCLPAPPPAPDLLDAENQVVQALPDFIETVRKSADALPDGRVDLQTLRRANAVIPETFVRAGRLATTWTDVTLIKYGHAFTLDFSSTRNPACRVMVIAASHIPAVTHIALSGVAADVQATPLTEDQATRKCGKENMGFIRLIVE